MHLSRLPSGSWRVAVKHGGQRLTGTAPTKNEARRLGAELLIELGGDGRRLKDANVTVNDMLARLLVERAYDPTTDRGWSPTFHADATHVVDKLSRDAPAFAARRVRDVTPSTLMDLHHTLRGRGWSHHRVKRLHTILSMAWKMAKRLEWCRSDPTAVVAPPTPERPDVRPPSSEQVAAILAELDGLDLLAVRLNATLGIRRGDLCGLQWSDFDAERAELLVARSIAYTPGQMHVMPTKSGRRSHRRLALDLPTVALLRKVRAKQTEDAVKAGLPAPVWVVSDDAGVSPWRPDRVSRLFRRVADRVGATGIRLHDLRHYVATSMLEDGESAHDVAGQLGNTPAVVESTYRHWVAGRGRQSVDRRAARLGE